MSDERRCHAPGERCHGCAHYHGKAAFCKYAPEMTDTKSDTLLTDAGDWPTPEHAQHIQFEGCDCVVMSPESHEALHESHRKLERQLTETRRLLAEASKDAERYRWLRVNINNYELLHTFREIHNTEDALDAEIDAAIKEQS